MSPVRKTADFRSEQIDSWQEYIDDEVQKLEVEGKLQGLPDRGKPIKIWKTDVNPEYDLAFSRLKNAGVMPMWMELDQEIGTLTDELHARLAFVESQLRGLIAQATPSTEPVATPEPSGWQRFTSWFRVDTSSDAPQRPDMTTILATRDRERGKFLELAARLDKKISTYHDSLPKGGEHLQRLRWLPDRAARVFDERITLSAWWEDDQVELS